MSRAITALFCLGALVVAGCGSAPFNQKPATATQDDDDKPQLSAEEKKYTALGERFTALLIKEDYAGLYDMCSSHLKSSMSQDQLIAARKKAQTEFGKALKSHPIEHANTDKEDLAGPNHKVAGEDELEAGARKIIAQDAVGTLPDSVPLSIRRASVRAVLVMDIATMPAAARGPDPIDKDEERVSLLTMVIVEENGELRIAHFWQRWPHLFD